jgi:hypothetical protein
MMQSWLRSWRRWTCKYFSEYNKTWHY